jgi:hypothetical protein
LSAQSFRGKIEFENSGTDTGRISKYSTKERQEKDTICAILTPRLKVLGLTPLYLL